MSGLYGLTAAFRLSRKIHNEWEALAMLMALFEVLKVKKDEE